MLVGLETTRAEAGGAAFEEEAVGCWMGALLSVRGINASASAGRDFVGRAESVLLPVSGLRGLVAPIVEEEKGFRFAGEGDRGSVGREDNCNRFDGDGDRVWDGTADNCSRFDGEGDATIGGCELCRLFANEVVTLRRFAPADDGGNTAVLVAGFALTGAFFTGEAGRLIDCPNNPSLVPGLLLCPLPFLLKAEVGRGGGPIGDCTGEKKLDLRRLSPGVVGKCCRLSIVRSESEGRDFVRSLGRKSSSSGGSVGSKYSSGGEELSSWKPCREAVRKPLREPSWSWFSPSSGLVGLLGRAGGIRCWLPREVGRLLLFRALRTGLVGCLGPVARVLVVVVATEVSLRPVGVARGSN